MRCCDGDPELILIATRNQISDREPAPRIIGEAVDAGVRHAELTEQSRLAVGLFRVLVNSPICKEIAASTAIAPDGLAVGMQLFQVGEIGGVVPDSSGRLPRVGAAAISPDAESAGARLLGADGTV